MSADRIDGDSEEISIRRGTYGEGKGFDMGKRISFMILLVVLLACIPLSLPPRTAWAAAGDILLASCDWQGIQGNGVSRLPALSPDGNYVAFQSDSSNLYSTATTNKQIFLKNLQNGTIKLCSESWYGQGNFDSGSPKVSRDGRYVFFPSNATNLIEGGTTGLQVFRRDASSMVVDLCSCDASGNQGNAGSAGPSASEDGRYVAFLSAATNLVPGGTTNAQVFRKDMDTGAITLCSGDAAGSQGNGDSSFCCISPDGRYVTFQAASTNLVPGGTTHIQIFRKDMDTGAITLCSSDAAGSQGNGDSSYPSISWDGFYVTYCSVASNLVPGGTAGGILQVFRKNLLTGETTLCSINSSGGQGNADTIYSCISYNGRYVTIDSSATNLISGGTTGRQIFRKDMDTGEITLCSSNAAGNQGNGESYVPSMNSNGRFVTYESLATNLAPGGTTGLQVFRKELSVSLPTTWYLAEGYTGGDFDTWVLVQNPGPKDARVTLDFQVQGGSAPAFGPLTLGGGQRLSIHLDTLAGLADAQVSTRVTSDQPVVVERAMYFNYDGKPGGHDSMGVTSPALTWYLAEGYTGSTFDTWVLVQNPGPRDAKVTLDFQVQGGSAPAFGPFTLAAGQRQSIHLDTLTGLGNAQVSTKVSSTEPVVAERAEYFDYDGKKGGHASAGVNAPAGNWYLAEGYTGGTFDTWVLIQNPGVKDAYAGLSFQVQGGIPTRAQVVTVKAGQRESVHLDAVYGLEDAQVSTKFSATEPVVVERAMYFNYEGKPGGHDSAGVNAPANEWYLAEGYTGGTFDTWVLIQNPWQADARVTLDFQVQGGSAPAFGPFTLGGGQRLSIHLDTLAGLGDAQVSTRVTSDQPVVVERAMYFNYEGKSGGHDSVGFTP